MEKNAELLDMIKFIFSQNKGRYGIRRVHKELANKGIPVNHKRVQRLMHEAGLIGKRPKEKYHSYKGEVGRIADNIINRDFSTTAPFQKWTTDVFQFNFSWGKCYISPILDMHTNEIGKAVAVRAKALGMKVLVCTNHLKQNQAKNAGVTIATAEEIFEQADVITNHMSPNRNNENYYNLEAFTKMIRQPVFINVSRGCCVDEDALTEALDRHLIFAAGLDVLKQEEPDLRKCKLIHRDNVILTPHAAFFSETSMRDLQKSSCENVVHYLKKEYDQVHAIVNKEIFE